MFRVDRFLITVLLAASVAACTGGNFAPVYDVYGTPSYSSKPATNRSKSIHVVSKGDTLFSIAWRYGWDYRALARANGIGAPYTIYPGQQIRVDGKTAASSRPASSSTSGSSSSGTASSAASNASTTPSRGSSPASSTSAGSTSTTSSSSAPAGHVVGPLRWRWPTTGNVIGRFSTSGVGPKGIAIGGREGQPVVAAESGVVVYQGSGLTGYGNLVIIKHNDRWLSAYAHNSRVVVKEGGKIKAGDKIAEMGSSGTDKVQLHFEIRRDGKPVNPLEFLPKK